MPIHPFRWQRSILRYSINGNVDFNRNLIVEAFRHWRQLMDLEFQEVPAGDEADIVIARLDEVKAAFPNHHQGEEIGLAVVITDGQFARIAYVGLQYRLGVHNGRLATHEIGHAIGFADDYPTDPNLTIMSLTLTANPRPEARDIAEVQAVYGPSPRDDVIYGGAGSGPIKGGQGLDVIYGNQGRDVLYGNQGNDTIFAGQDADTLFGGQDQDALYGNQGNDAVYGNMGFDTLYGGAGDDTLYGGQHDDVMFGGMGTDVLYGGAGYDRVEYRGDVRLAGNVVTGPGFHHTLYGVDVVRINGIDHPISS